MVLNIFNVLIIVLDRMFYYFLISSISGLISSSDIQWFSSFSRFRRIFYTCPELQWCENIDTHWHLLTRWNAFFLPPSPLLSFHPRAPSLPQSFPVSLSLPLSFSRTTSLSLPLSPSFFNFLLIFLPFYLPSYVWVASFFYYLITK